MAEASSTKPATKADLDSVRSEIHEVKVVVESLQDGQQRIVEAMQGMEARLTGEFDRRMLRVEVRLEMVEQALRETSHRVGENQVELRRIAQELAQLRVETHDLAHRRDRHEVWLSDLERRVAELERQVPRSP